MRKSPGYRTLRVLSIQDLSPTAYAARFERGGIAFVPGQCVSVGRAGSSARRDYSIASGLNDDFIEILVRDVPGGEVSPALHRLRQGDFVEVGEPGGFFRLRRPQGRHLFLATGTGVAPFLSFLRTWPDLDFRLVHGIRTPEDAFLLDRFSPGRYVPCVSRAPCPPHFSGRVTDWLAAQELGPEQSYYLCGNSKMVYDAREILLSCHVPADDVLAEIYF